MDNIQKKFAEKVCNCIGKITFYEDLKPKLDACYDKTYNEIFNGATPEEVKFYANANNLRQVVSRLEFYLKSACPEVVRVINEYVKPSNSKKAFPVNFTDDDLKNLLANNWVVKNDLVAFEGVILKATKTESGKLFLKVVLDSGNAIWVGDMTNSPYSAITKRRKFLGYIVKADKDKAEHNENSFVVVSFASVNNDAQQLSMYPGSEKQIYEWANGRMPEARN